MSTIYLMICIVAIAVVLVSLSILDRKGGRRNKRKEIVNKRVKRKP